MTLVLRRPSPADEAPARRLHEQLDAEGFAFLLGEGTWPELLAQVDRESRGVDLAPGRVRADFPLADHVCVVACPCLLDGDARNASLAVPPAIPWATPTVAKILAEMRANPRNIGFAELAKVCEHYFGAARMTSGSHAVYKTPWPGNPRVNIQNDHGKAKAYQVRQVLLAIEKLEGT